MKLQAPHSWNLTPKEAIALQREMAGQVIRVDALGEVKYVAGVDVGFEDQRAITRAAVAVLSYPDLKLVDSAVVRQPTRFPYVPGLLSFREIPALLEALSRLHVEPDLLLCDGQGIAHPRRFGYASHLGVITGVPSIGVAKSRLIGEHADPPLTRGSWVPLYDHREVIGAVLRSRAGIQPLYVSIGHRISLASAVRFVLDCTTRFRLPETTRAAHHLASG